MPYIMHSECTQQKLSHADGGSPQNHATPDREHESAREVHDAIRMAMEVKMYFLPR